MAPSPDRGTGSVPTLLAAALLSLAALVPTAGAQSLRQLQAAVDYNPDPRIFETVLVPFYQEVQLVSGQKTWMMVYNGTSPGPTIEANLGDTLIVHFLNILPEPTTVHWHGVEMPAQMDGSHISQAPIPQFGYFRYEFKLTTAGTYWYHPHIKTNEQIEKGLYGALIVRDPAQDARIGIPRSRERVIFLDDVKLDGDNRFAPFSTDPNAPFVPWQRAEDLANSRPGNHVLINGEERTDTNIPTLEVLAGAAYRLRFLNPSNGEVWRLDIKDPQQKWYGIGSDQGLWNAAEQIRPIDKIVNPFGHHSNLISNPDTRLGVTLAPSDRMEVVILPTGSVGTEYFIDFHDFIKGNHIAFRDPLNNLVFGHDHFDGSDDPYPGIRIKVVGTYNGAPWQPSSNQRPDPILPLGPDLDQAPLPVVFGHALPDKVTGDVIFFANVARPQDLLHSVRTRQMTMPPMFGPIPAMKLTPQDGYHVKVGGLHYFEVVNFAAGDHTFHTHGFSFQHIDTEYIDLDTPRFNRVEPPLRLANEDTIRVPKRPGEDLGRSFTIVRLAIRFDDSAKAAALRRNPAQMLAGGLTPTSTSSGGWLVHCHHLEHAARGMGSFITITR